MLQNADTDEIVISFRGTELPKTTATKVKEKYLGTPSQDAALLTGKAKLNPKDKTHMTPKINLQQLNKWLALLFSLS
ncbi:hypothetical protein ABZ530_02020 [Micrococcus luteus]|uniref:Uncharacterized protein n=1 Tax=Virgibacillus pantothenticus TaxID=1473 RepID=A0A0L0QSU4_VIRPA|nr:MULTISPECIES: hypothetical protein [Virgibacillus]API92151.1 hypothetical protein BKP57_10100 [Virgibacillus sp. 6R]KNE21238.1 hypothetical protein AFK71_06010 [Virgibacillus pantothenticus]MBS7427257.1 hypothetical protein [Virgibacillus sp. 19R1-5]MBU8568947.1 hypothetical protein [Virgibacillus pantothenticus]MBU8602982.1 hypothetical protein [Virgibacillus pantothenticus]